MCFFHKDRPSFLENILDLMSTSIILLLMIMMISRPNSFLFLKEFLEFIIFFFSRV